MRAFLSALMREGVISIVVLALLCLLVWFGGMYLGMEQGHRILIILALLSIWAVVFVVQKVLAVRQSARIEQQLKAQGGSELEGADADKKAEIEALRSKFDESLQSLKKSKGGKSALYTLPWYVIIGPPGSGKTTALQESGLNFPAAQGGAKVRGIGGTRNCDWWFTSDGILLDTAGRYTTVAEDQEEWFAFLEMIKSSRSGRPINGAIVAIAVDDLFRSSEAELLQMAKDVRNRLDELAARLQAVFPVYVMFTKCDLVSGFVEFFEDFNKDERSQVWGFSLPYSLPERQYTDIFDEEVAKLESRVKARRLDLLTAERPPIKKQSIYLFPHQLKLATNKMRDFLESLFGASAFQESAMLRGIYFTSGTQKGTPIDQILSRMGEAMGLSGESAEGVEERIEKKSYFIHDLFARIIFGDKTLARSNRAVLRKRRAMRLGINLVSLLVLVVMAWVLIGSFIGNHEIVSEVEAAGVAVQELDDDAQELEKLKALDGLRHELTTLHEFQREGRPLRLSFGMYHGDTMFDAGAQAYFAQLHPAWVAPCHERLEGRLREIEARLSASSDQENQRLLDLWLVYRMMGGVLDAEPSLVTSVLHRENLWTGGSGTASGEIEHLARKQLEFYAQMLPYASARSDPYKLHIKPDPSLVRRVGERLKQGFWERVAYDAIIKRTSESMSPLTLEHIVPGGELYMEFRPKLGDSPFLTKLNAFSQAAWDQHVKSLIDERAESLASLYDELEMGDRDADEWRSRLTKLHRDTHINVWNEYLNAVIPDPAAFRKVNNTRDALGELVKDNSVYRKLIQNVWERRRITLAPNDQVPGPTKEELDSLEAAFEVLKEFRTAYDTYARNTDENKRVLTYLEKPEPLDALAKAFTAASTKIKSPFSSRNESAGNALEEVIDASFTALREEAVTEVEGLWKDRVFDVWQKEFVNRYPFETDPATDASRRVSMTEFSKMFNPKNGAIWRAHNLIDAVSGLRFGGKDLYSTASTYRDSIASAEKIRTAMFDKDDDELASIRFRVQLNQRGNMATSTLHVGKDEQLAWNKQLDQARDFHWKQDPTNTVGAMVEAAYKRIDAGERQFPLPKKDASENEWGVLTIFWRHAHVFRKIEDTNQYEVQWLFISEDKLPWMLFATLTPSKEINPFDRELFTGMKMSEKVTK